VKLVYVAEAHAQDEWPLRSARFNGNRGPVLVDQPKTTADRARLARAFADNFQLPAVDLFVDDPALSEPFERAYSPWPLRLYLVDTSSVGHPTLLWIAEPSDCAFDKAVAHLRHLLLSSESSS